MKNITIITHTQYKNGSPVPGPAGSILEFFSKYGTIKVLYLQHSLYGGFGSTLTEHIGVSNKPIKSYAFQAHFPEPLRYIADILIGFFTLLDKERQDIIIAADPLNFVTAYMLKVTGKVSTVVYYSLDYAYQRFQNTVLNKVYHLLDKFSAKKSDYTFGACRKICEIRTKDGIEDSRNLYLPNSPILEGVTIRGIEEAYSYTLVMVFSDYTQIDFHIIFKALEELIPTYPDIKVKLIGRGMFESEVKKLITNQSLLPHIVCLDTKTHLETLTELSTSTLGLECNNQTVAWNAFREPIKIREYIALGLPVITKRGHALIDEIQNQKLGIVIETAEDLVNAVKHYFGNPQIFRETRIRELEYAKNFNKEKILSEFFKKGNII